MMTDFETLEKLGYRDLHSALYIKLIGYHVLIFDDATNLLSNVVQMNGKLWIWDQQEIDPNDPEFIGLIKSFENYQLALGNCSGSQFDLESQDLVRLVSDAYDAHSTTINGELSHIFGLIDGDQFDDAKNALQTLEDKIGMNVPELIRASTMISFLAD